MAALPKPLREPSTAHPVINSPPCAPTLVAPLTNPGCGTATPEFRLEIRVFFGRGRLRKRPPISYPIIVIAFRPGLAEDYRVSMRHAIPDTLSGSPGAGRCAAATAGGSTARRRKRPFLVCWVAPPEDKSPWSEGPARPAAWCCWNLPALSCLHEAMRLKSENATCREGGEAADHILCGVSRRGAKDPCSISDRRSGSGPLASYSVSLIAEPLLGKLRSYGE